MQIFPRIRTIALVLNGELNSFNNPHSDCLPVVMQEGYNISI